MWVQVVEQQVQEEGTPQLAEAHLTAGLSHPNIVLTHKAVSRTRTVRCPPAIISLVPLAGSAVRMPVLVG